jgi:hypothetical protein
MIDIKNAQTKQITSNGIDGDWVASLNGKELYRLPAYITANDTFLVKDIILKMVELAKDEAKTQHKSEINEILKRGQHQLDVLKAENERISNALEQHILTDEA